MIKILLFAHLSEEIGEKEITIDAAGCTVAELKERLLEKYPKLPLENVFTAVNEEYTGEDEKLQENDVVAFIPPVSGG